jgi:hypothetical protein
MDTGLVQPGLLVPDQLAATRPEMAGILYHLATLLINITYAVSEGAGNVAQVGGTFRKALGDLACGIPSRFLATRKGDTDSDRGAYRNSDPDFSCLVRWAV